MTSVNHEEWRWVDGWPYEVSSQGRVRRVVGGPRKINPGFIIKPCYHEARYLQVSLSKNGTQRIRLIHRLVAEAFLGSRPPDTQVNHKNGIKADNHVENLEWVTPKENIQHASRLGLLGGVRHHSAKLNPVAVVCLRWLYRHGVGPTRLAKAYNLSRQTIQRACFGQLWRRVDEPKPKRRKSSI